MSILTSILADLLQAMPQLRPQLYFKSSLTALSHAMEDQVLAGPDRPLVIASFQRERFYRQEAHRYRRIAERTPQVYVLAAPEAEFKSASGIYETVAFEPTDPLSKEWHLVVVGQQYSTCLICRERPAPAPDSKEASEMEAARRFEGIWTFERQATSIAVELLLERILAYRPELADKIQQARTQFLGVSPPNVIQKLGASESKSKRKKAKKEEILPFYASSLPSEQPPTTNPAPFVERLVAYLQVGQYKLLKAYRSIAAQEQKERLVNSITAAIRRSLNSDEIMQVAVQELGQSLNAFRCLIYCCKATDTTATITNEFLRAADGDDALFAATLGQSWPLQNNALFQEVVQQREPVYVADTQADPRLINSATLQALVRKFSIGSWLMVPVLYKDALLGMVELHHCGSLQHEWQEDELALVEAIATQVGSALIQAEAYANLEDLNQQLEALDRTRANLVAITGHELRTPLSTIQVCLESLASEPDMSLELRQVMLNTALADAERMRKLVQDFLTLSRLESGRVEWHPEPLSLQECIDLALSGIRARRSDVQLPEITTQVSPDVPLVRADGEWLVEVLTKLLDNACKFTTTQGKVMIQASSNGSSMLEVTVADTGRGIEPNGLEAVFDRFYQEEGALRRTTGGTGLGLAICRQIVNNWGGEIWAESAGKDQGSEFHFTIPIVTGRPEPKRSGKRRGDGMVG
ncbi:MAG: GAF domain-containing protein [Aphanothece sp. CMT-3BRIN-NPC111]|nr:GAF domain-containing protein [Aphanothece sp. CMT-3BRIN-NPC111]